MPTYVPKFSSSLNDSPAPPISVRHIKLDKSLEPIYHAPNGFICKTTHRPSSRDIHHYSIVEDLSQAPSAMFSLEVLKSFSHQCKDLFSAISGVHPYDSNLIAFNVDRDTIWISHQTSYIIVYVFRKNVGGWSFFYLHHARRLSALWHSPSLIPLFKPMMDITLCLRGFFMSSLLSWGRVELFLSLLKSSNLH